MSARTFNLSDDKLQCDGSYNSIDRSRTIFARILCSDGRRRIITATRDVSGRGGHGTDELTDDSEWDVLNF
jgi:hypothetical protein